MFSRVFEVFGVIAVDNEPALQAFNQLDAQATSSVGNVNRTLDTIGQGATDTGRAVTTAFAPLAALQGVAIAVAANFEQQMLNVQAISGATGEELELMTDQARDLGATTSFSASQAAEGMQYLAMAGFDAQEVLAAMPGMLDLAAAGSLDLAQAADIASNVMASFRYEADRSTEVADRLAYVASNSNTDVSELGEAISYAGATSAGLGFSLEDTLSAIAMLANTGVKGSRAGRNLATTLSEIGTKAEGLGLNVYDANGNLLGLQELLVEIESQGWTTQQVLDNFGMEAGRTLVSLLASGSDAAGEFSHELNNSADGVARFVAETKLSGFLGSVEELQGALEEFALTVADSGLLEGAQNWIDKLTEIVRAASDLDPRLLRLITVVIAVGTAMGPALLIIGQLAFAISSLLTPVGFIIGLFTVLGGSALGVATNFEAFKSIVDVLDVAIKQFTGRTLRQLNRELRGVVRQIGTFVRDAGSGLYNTFVGIGTDVVEGIVNGVTAAGSRIYNTVRAWIQGVIDTVKNVLGISSPSTEFYYIGEMIVDGLELGLQRMTAAMMRIVHSVQFLYDLLKARTVLFRKDVWVAIETLAEVEGSISRTFETLEDSTSATMRAVQVAIEETLPFLKLIAGLMFGDFILGFYAARAILRAFGVDVDALQNTLTRFADNVVLAFSNWASQFEEPLRAAYYSVDRFVYDVEQQLFMMMQVLRAMGRFMEREYGSVLVGAFIFLRNVLDPILRDINARLLDWGINTYEIARLTRDGLEAINYYAERGLQRFAGTVFGQHILGMLDEIRAAVEALAPSLQAGLGEVARVANENRGILIPLATGLVFALTGQFARLPMILASLFDIIPFILRNVFRSADNILTAFGFRTGTSLRVINRALDNFSNVARNTIEDFSLEKLRLSFEYFGEFIRVVLRQASYTFARFRLEIQEQVYKLVDYSRVPSQFFQRTWIVLSNFFKNTIALIVLFTGRIIPNLIQGFWRAGEGINSGFVSILRIFEGALAAVSGLIVNVVIPVFRELGNEGKTWEAVGTTLALVFSMLATEVNRLAAIFTVLFAEGTWLRRQLEALAGIVGVTLTAAFTVLNALLRGVIALISGDFRGALNQVAYALGHVLVGAIRIVQETFLGLLQMFFGDDVRAAAENMIAGVIDAVQQFFVIVRAIPNAIGAVNNFLFNAVNNFVQAIIEWVQNIPYAIHAALVEAQQRVVETITRFDQLGHDIVNGIINGINGAVGALQDTVVGTGERIVGWFKSTLGIASPSTITAAHGADFVRGFTQGLNSESVVAERAVTGLADRLSRMFSFDPIVQFDRLIVDKATIQNTITELHRVRDALTEAGLEGTTQFASIESQIAEAVERLGEVNTALLDNFDTTALRETQGELASTISELEAVEQAIVASGDANTQVYEDITLQLEQYRQEHADVTDQIIAKEAAAAKFVEVTGESIADFRADVTGEAIDQQSDLTDATIEGAEARIEAEQVVYDAAYETRQAMFALEDEYYDKLVDNGNASIEEWIRVLEARLELEGLAAQEIAAIEGAILELRVRVSNDSVDIAERTLEDRLALEYAGLEATAEITRAELDLLKARYDYAVLTAADSAAFEIEMLNRVAAARGLTEGLAIEIDSRIYSAQQTIARRSVSTARTTAKQVKDAYIEAIEAIEAESKIAEYKYELKLINSDQFLDSLRNIQTELEGRLAALIASGDTGSERFEKLAQALRNVTDEVDALADSMRGAWLDKLGIQAAYNIRPIEDIREELERVRDELRTEISGYEGLATTPEALDSLSELHEKLVDVEGALSNVIDIQRVTWMDKLVAQADLGTRSFIEIREEIARTIRETEEEIASYGHNYGADYETLGQVQALYDLLQELEAAYEGINELERDNLAISEAQAKAAITRITNTEDRIAAEIAFLEAQVQAEKERLKEGEETSLELIRLEEELFAKRMELTDAEIAAETRRADYLYSINELSKEDYLAFLNERLAGMEEYTDEWIALQNKIRGIEEETVEDLRTKWEKLREEIRKTFEDETAERIALFSVTLRELGEQVGGTAEEFLNAAGDVVEGIAMIADAGGDAEKVLNGLAHAMGGLTKMFPEQNSAANDAVETYYALTGVVAELIFRVPGLGKAMAAFGKLVSAVLGDMENGIKAVKREIDELQESYSLIDVGQIVRTRRVSRGGILGWLGLTKTEIDRAATNLATAIADKLEGIGNVLTDSMKGFLTGAVGPDGVLTQLREGVRSSIEDAIIQSIIQGAVFKGAIGDLLTQLTNAIAAGEDPTGIIREINAALPGVRDTIVNTLEPVKDMLDDVFGERPSEEDEPITYDPNLPDMPDLPDLPSPDMPDGDHRGNIDPEDYTVIDVSQAPADPSAFTQPSVMASAHQALTGRTDQGIMGALGDISNNGASENTLRKIYGVLKEGAGQVGGKVEVIFRDKVVIREDADINRIADTLALRVRDANKGM